MADLKNRIISESSYPDVLARLLFEEVEDAAKAITAVQKAFQTRNTQLASLVNSLPSGKYKDGLSAFVKSVEEGTQQASEKVDQVDTDDDKAADQVDTISKSYEQLNATVKQVLDVNIALMSNLAKTILESNLHKGPNKDIPMIQILEESDLVDSANKELSDAFDSSGVKPLKKPKGFLASIFSKSFGETEEAVELANEVVEQKDNLIGAVLEMTPIEIGKFAQAIVNYGKTDESAASKIETATETASEEAENEKAQQDPDAEAPADDEAADDEAAEAAADDEAEDEPKPMSKKDLIDKVRNNPMLGDGGAMVLDRIIDAGLFDDLGIELSESLKKRTLSVLLLEKKLDAEEYQAAFDLAAEEEPEKFEDIDAGDVASELNSVFAEENIDVQIEVPTSGTETAGDEEVVDLEEEVDEAAESLEKEEPEIASLVDKATKEDKDLEKEVILRLIRPVDISSLPGDSEFKDQAADQQRELEEYVVKFFKAVKKAGLKAGAGSNNSLTQTDITKYAKFFSQYAEKRDDLLLKHQESVDGKYRVPNPWANPTAAAKGMIFSIAAALEALDEEAEDAVNKAISDNSWTRIQKTITGEGVEQEAHLSRLQKLAGIL